MSLSPKDPHDRLLADTLHDDWASGPASAMARRAAALARLRRTVRRGAVALGMAFVLVALGIITLRRESSAPVVTVVASPAVVPAQTAAVSTPGYEIVSDEEFFALLRDRPLLVLPEEKGAKKFVVLAY